MVGLKLKRYYKSYVCHLHMVMFVIADVRKTIDDLKKVMKNFESRVEFTEDLQKMSDVSICFQSSYFFFYKNFFLL